MYKKKYWKIYYVIVFSVLFLGLLNTQSWSKEHSTNVHLVFCLNNDVGMKARGKNDLLKTIIGETSNEFAIVKKNSIKTMDRVTFFSPDEKVQVEATLLYQSVFDMCTLSALPDFLLEPCPSKHHSIS